MLGVQDWERVKQRYREYWAMENETPLFRMSARREQRHEEEETVSLETAWLDNEYQIRQARRDMENRIYGGEGFPILCADFGPDIFGAVLGDDIEFGWDTSWAKHLFAGKDWSSVDLKFDERNLWWKRVEQRIRDFIADANGDYLVGFPDWHGSCDALVSLFGPEEVALALYDCPEEVKRLNKQIAAAFREIMQRSYALLKDRQEGTTHWIGLWNDGLWYTTSCDFNILLSGEMLEEFVIPPLEEDLAFLQSSTYHLDGSKAFRHLDRLLELPNLHGIQLVYGAGEPPALHWLPELKRIQAAGKGIHLVCTTTELDTILEELKPQGLFLALQPDWEKGEGPFTEEDIRYFTKKIDPSAL